MAIFLDTRDIADRFGDYIEELRAILVANTIKFGSPDNFFEFARRLQSDDLLPGDLSRMFESIVDREKDEVSAKTILTIIAIAVGGVDVAETGRDLSKPVKRVIDFLIRSGNCSLIDQADNPAHLSSSSDLLLRQTFDDSTKLIHSMARLELSAARATSYLDSTEQRISRMDPRPANIPTWTTPLSNQPHALDAEPLHHTDSPVERPSISNDLPFPNFVRQAPPQTKEHLAWLFAFGTRLAAPPLLATIAGGALLYISYPRSSGKTELPQAVPDAAATIATINPPPPTDIIASAAQPQNPLTVVSIGRLAKPSPSKPFSTSSQKPRSHSSRNIAGTPGPVQPTPDHATQNSALHGDGDVEAAETQPHDATEAPVKKDVRYLPMHASVRPIPSPRTIDVSSGVMAANLLSASPPSYPKLASLTHMQGTVVMQAIISKDGTVQNLQVIQGHRLLRNAAKNSARTWRYRPYLVNGKPVEVATIVSVDFTLPH
jgi:TonB family protein